MGNTTLMVIPVPDEFQDPFFATMNNAGGFFESVDAWLQAIREDADLMIVESGAPWDINVGTNTVTWGNNIVLRSATDGGTITIAASSIVCADDPGVLYVTVVTRPIAAPVVLTMHAGATKGVLSANDVVVAVRQGAQAVLRNDVVNHSPELYTYAGNPIGNVTASKIGDVCIDTVNSLTYVAYAADAVSWQIG